MKPGIYSSLIQAIEKIYYSIAWTGVQKRMDSYNKDGQGNSGYADGIHSPLMAAIDEMTIDQQHTEDEVQHSDDPVPGSPATDLYSPLPHNDNKARVFTTEDVGDLSKHFREHRNESGLSSGIVEKLEHSTWQHINAAIRYAKKGEHQNAKIHADIANSACKELAHFMYEEQYKDFIVEIENHLENLKQTSQKSN